MADPSAQDITGTLSGMDVNGLIQAMALQQAQAEQGLAQRTAQANQQAGQAQQAYAQAQAAPPPQLGSLATLLPVLLGNTASVLSGNQEYSQRGQQTVQRSRSELLQQRADNLQSLHDAFVQKAKEAQQAGDTEAEVKARNQAELAAKRAALTNDELNRQNRLQVANIQASSRERVAGYGAGGGAGGGKGGGGLEGDANSIADAIVSGKQPPDTKGLYRFGGPVRAALARRGYDFTAASRDWQAVQRGIATLNGPQQTRLRQAVETAYNSLDVIDDLNTRLAKALPRGRFPVLNKAALLAAKNGLAGKEAQSLATQLDAQLTDVVSELGNAYMGGNSPTDHALRLAAQNLSSNWSPEVLKAGTDLARKNLLIRRNSIYSTNPINPGVAPPPIGQQPGTPSPATPKVQKWGRDANGNPVPIQ